MTFTSTVSTALHSSNSTAANVNSNPPDTDAQTGSVSINFLMISEDTKQKKGGGIGCMEGV